MAIDDNRGIKRAAWQLDLGPGRKIDTEFDSSGDLWVASGEAVQGLSAWFKDVAGLDIRVGVERRDDGLVIRLDRGDNQPHWWSDEEAPQMVLQIVGPGRVQVSAHGSAIDQEVVLARSGF